MALVRTLLILLVVASLIGVGVYAYDTYMKVKAGPIQDGDDPIIGYVHPVATVKIDNSALDETITITLMNLDYGYDNLPDSQSIEPQSITNPKDVNLKAVFTFSGMSIITEGTYHVGIGYYDRVVTVDIASEKSFGMRTPGTYTLSVSLYDMPHNTLLGTKNIQVVVH